MDEYFVQAIEDWYKKMFSAGGLEMMAKFGGQNGMGYFKRAEIYSTEPPPKKLRNS